LLNVFVVFFCLFKHQSTWKATKCQSLGIRQVVFITCRHIAQGLVKLKSAQTKLLSQVLSGD